jgi:hypothetical protein
VFAEQRRQRGEEFRVQLDPGGCFAYPVDASISVTPSST